MLRVNYRTTEQIRRFADRVLAGTADDLDEGQESRRGCHSILRGPVPVARGFATAAEQQAYIAGEVAALIARGYAPEEIAIFARSNARADTMKKALESVGLAARRLGQGGDAPGPCVALGTLHRAKGLEFKVVFVAGADAETLPLRDALQGLDDPADLAAARERERSLLYAGLTRARDLAYVTWTGEPSPFLPGRDEG